MKDIWNLNNNSETSQWSEVSSSVPTHKCYYLPFQRL